MPTQKTATAIAAAVFYTQSAWIDRAVKQQYNWFDKSEFSEDVEIMRIDFNDIDSMTFPGMNNGTGMMSARMYNDDSYRIIPTSIHPGGSIGPHKQESGDDMNYIISGNGKAFCDGTEEALKPGVMHICPKGSVHSIVNTGEEDLVMLTIVVKK